VVLYIVLISGAILFVQAQAVPSTSATCLAGFDWSFNAQGQSPCLLSAYLGAVCSITGEWNVPALPEPGVRYSPSSATLTKPCECNTVFYNAISMCALCQNGNLGLWSDWIAACPSNETIISKYPFMPPTTIPAWAFYNPTTSNFFNTTAAQQLLYSTGSPGYNDLGAIVGGAVGGAAGLVLIIILALWFARRQKLQHQDQSITPYIVGAPPQLGTTQFQHSMPPIPYDPDDPTTFPQVTPPNVVMPLSQSIRTQATFESTPYQPIPPRATRQPLSDRPQRPLGPAPSSSDIGFAPNGNPISPRAGSTIALSGPSPRAQLSSPELQQYAPGPWNAPRANIVQP